MDERTLLSYKPLWGVEKEPHPSITLANLTVEEQVLYEKLKRNTLGQNVRLEQERISWDFAWREIQEVASD
ncbi:hypothetical protein SAMN03159307_05521 [Pseudomonas sp. NFACC46-3]|nr:hypothetical protein SAMN03159424_05753 [Pseudomonas sp. NFACC05-1]SFM03626.1 hypothetical protein SAMN03159307_05521 [Pseudomonas sp. NFACC46-3]